MNKLKGFVSLLACATIFASFSVYVRVLNQDLLAYQQIAFRNFLGFIIALLVVLYTKQSFTSLKKVETKFIALYALSFPFAVVFFTISVLQTRVVTSIFALYTGALITSLIIGLTAFKEKITPIKTISLILAFIGLFAFAHPFNLDSVLNLGFIFGVLSGVVDAIANSFRKYLAGKVDRFVLVLLQMIGGLAVAICLMAFFNQLSFPQISPTSWLVGGLFGLSLVAISYLTLVGFQNFDLNLGTVILSSEIFFASLFALLFFQEKTTFTELLGGTLIIISTAIVNLTIKKESRLDRILKLLKFSS